MLTVLGEDIASQQSYLCVANNTHGQVTLSFTIETLGKLSKHSSDDYDGVNSSNLCFILTENISFSHKKRSCWVASSAGASYCFGI